MFSRAKVLLWLHISAYKVIHAHVHLSHTAFIQSPYSDGVCDKLWRVVLFFIFMITLNSFLLSWCVGLLIRVSVSTLVFDSKLFRWVREKRGGSHLVSSSSQWTSGFVPQNGANIAFPSAGTLIRICSSVEEHTVREPMEGW